MRLPGERESLIRRRRRGAWRRQSQEADERLADQLGRGSDFGEPLAKRRHPDQHVPQPGDCRSGGGEIRGGGGALEVAKLFHRHRRPGVDRLRQPGHRILKCARVRTLDGETGPLDEDRQIVRPSRQQVFEQLLRLGVGVLAGGPLDLLRERKAGAKIVRRQFDGAAEVGNRLIEAAARRFQLTEQQHDLGARRRERCRPLDGLQRRIEVTEPEVCQAEVRPGGRLARHQFRRPRELSLRVVEQADLKRSEAAIERPDGFLVHR